MAFAPISGRLALLVGGGPAPGLNGVISSATIEGIEQGVEVIGFQDGFKWLVQGDATHFRKLTIDDVKDIHLRGGSILGTSRTNPTKSDEHMRNVLETLRKLNVTMLVTIGGDDTAFSGSQVYQRAGGKFASPTSPRPLTTICRCPARRRRSVTKPPGILASASSAIWPRTPARRRAGI